MKKILVTIMMMVLLISFDSVTASAAVDVGQRWNAGYATVVPKIDGKIDEIWNNTQKIKTSHGSKSEFASGQAKILWTEDTLYLMAEIIDRTAETIDVNNTANQACFWVSETASAEQEYFADGDWNISINQSGIYEYYSGENLETIASYAAKFTDDGYVVEVAIPRQAESSYKTGEKIGFCLSVEDDVDGDNVRDSVCASQDTNYWDIPDNLYEVTLVGGSSTNSEDSNGDSETTDGDSETTNNSTTKGNSADDTTIDSASKSGSKIIMVISVLTAICVICVVTILILKKKTKKQDNLDV